MSVYMTMAIRRQGRCAEPRSRVPYPVQVVRMRQAAEVSARHGYAGAGRTLRLLPSTPSPYVTGGRGLDGRPWPWPCPSGCP